MNETKKATQEFQNNFNQYLEQQVRTTFGHEIGQNFRAFQHSGDFNYFTNDGTYYNQLTLQCLDSLLKEDAETGLLSLEESGFSKLYHNVLDVTRYTLSQSSQQKVNEGIFQSTAQMTEVIRLYPAQLPALTAETQNDKIIEIYENCATAFGGDVTMDCSIIPNIYRNFKIALQTLNNISEESAQLVMNVANKNAVLSKIINNMVNPSAQNAGLPLKGNNFYVGYDKIPMPSTLFGSLGTEGNSLTVSIHGDSTSQSEMHVHIDNEAPFILPINLLLSIEGNHQSSFDMDKLHTQSTQLDVEITYSGLTKVPVQPTPSNISGDKGWYAETTILKEVKNKSRTDTDGYKLTGSEFDPDELFGHDLASLQALLISKLPSVTITLTKINMDYAHSVFQMENDVTVTLFGFIKIGHHHNYETSNVIFDDDESTVKLTFSQPNVSGTLDPETATAFIMGGVPYYPGMN